MCPALPTSVSLLTPLLLPEMPVPHLSICQTPAHPARPSWESPCSPLPCRARPLSLPQPTLLCCDDLFRACLPHPPPARASSQLSHLSIPSIRHAETLRLIHSAKMHSCSLCVPDTVPDTGFRQQAGRWPSAVVAGGSAGEQRGRLCSARPSMATRRWGVQPGGDEG